MHGQSPASPEGGRYLSRVGGGVVALGQTGERHPWISFVNVHNTALGAHWARVIPSNLILTTSNRRHACATLTVARPWAHGPVLRAAALAEAIFVTRGRAPSGPGATPVRTREHGDQSARESLV